MLQPADIDEYEHIKEVIRRINPPTDPVDEVYMYILCGHIARCLKSAPILTNLEEVLYGEVTNVPWMINFLIDLAINGHVCWGLIGAHPFVTDIYNFHKRVPSMGGMDDKLAHLKMLYASHPPV